MFKNSYPNYDQYQYIPNQRNVEKWKLTAKNIHYKQRLGIDYKDAIKELTQGWSKMEIFDFLNWLRFQDEGVGMKYKQAQVWYENGQPGYFLHIKPDPQKTDEQKAQENKQLQIEQDQEKRAIIEAQRNKIISRLDSAEKLLRSQEGHVFAGNELEQLIETLYDLKKKIHLINKKSASTRIYDDLIIRQANILSRQGFVKAAEVLYSVAQTAGMNAENASGSINGTSDISVSPPEDPSGAGQTGTMSGLPATIPGVPNINTPVDGDQNMDTPPIKDLLNQHPTNLNQTVESTPSIMPQEVTQPKGIQDFIENMNMGNKTYDDELEVEDHEDMLMVSEAQVAPEEDIPMTSNPAPERNPSKFIPAKQEKPAISSNQINKDVEEPLEVHENELPSVGRVDNKINQVLDDVSIQDVIAKLEDISKIFKTREIPRQIALADIMLHSLNLASYFPSLSEVQGKTIEWTNYCSTRLDDIVSKLSGTLQSSNIDLKNNQLSPETEAIQNKLRQDQEKEKHRKQMRKEQENADLDEKSNPKETPNVEMSDLSAPVQTPSVPSTPIAQK